MSKDYVKSSIITFVTVFLLTFLPLLGDASWDKASIIAIVTVSARAGIKAIVDLIQNNTKLLG